jgi:replication factor C small subunit
LISLADLPPKPYYAALGLRRIGAAMKEIWVEKYRPKTLDEVVGQDEIVERLKAYAATKNLPHLLFAGPPGTGKTTSAMALARDMFGEDWRQNYYELNSSDERGIDVVRSKIKEIARLAPFGGTTFKIIFLDEADNLTADAQAALRRTMETYSKTSRFILSANYSSRLIEPIQSRTAVFRFRPLKPEAIREYLTRIAKAEKLKITDDGIDALIYIASGDMRRAVNSLQVAASLGSTIDADVLYKVASTIKPEEVKKLIEKALTGDFLRAREVLDRLLIEYGVSGEDVLRQLHRSVFDINVPDEYKVLLLDRIGETDFRLIEGSNERIQLEALLAHFTLIGKELNKK